MQVNRETSRSRMLIGRDRLFYSGLVGNSMKTRRLGAITIYAAAGDHFDIQVGDSGWQSRQLVALAPFTPHRLRSPDGHITNICIESETIEYGQMHTLISTINGSDSNQRLISRIRAARREITQIRNAGGFSTDEFDRYFLRARLAARDIDPRIRHVLDILIDDVQNQTISAGECAAEVGLSTSRFLHLFKENTGIPFRSERMWKRARRFLDHANRNQSLTEVALELGYPDSSHFSHSIRSCFGLQPRSIREGSRQLDICLGANYAIPAAYA